MNLKNLPIIVADEVQKAIDEKKPIVALESTIIAHGLAYPFNVQIAEELENTIREKNATPATIALIDGIIRIGLDKKQIEFIATDKNVRKTSKREIPFVISDKGHGGT